MTSSFKSRSSSSAGNSPSRSTSSASRCRRFTAKGIPGESSWLRDKPGDEGGLDVDGDEGADTAAETGNFLNNARTKERVGIFGHHENGFDSFVELTIHQSELKFKFKVGNSAQAANDGLGGAALNI